MNLFLPGNERHWPQSTFAGCFLCFISQADVSREIEALYISTREGNKIKSGRYGPLEEIRAWKGTKYVQIPSAEEVIRCERDDGGNACTLKPSYFSTLPWMEQSAFGVLCCAGMP